MSDYVRIFSKTNESNRVVAWNDNTFYNLRNGFILTENLGQELDSGTIVITNISESQDIELHPYDRVIIHTDNGISKNYLIASYEKSYISYDPIKYQYTINLMSLTKLLEIPIPSMTITQNNPNYQIKYFYILNKLKMIVQSMYASKMIDFTITYNNTLPFYNDVVPELTFTNPTIKEVLTTLFSVKGCVPTLKRVNSSSFRIDILDLNARKSECDTQYFVDKKMSNTAENYATTLVSNIENAVGDRTITENVKLQCDGVAFTTESMCIKTQYPIYDIVSVKAKLLGHSGVYDYDSTYGWRYVSEWTNAIVDITKYVHFKDVYDALTVKKANQVTDKVNKKGKVYDTNIYKNNSIYFERTSKTLGGINYKESYTIWFVTEEDYTALQAAMLCALDSLRTTEKTINTSLQSDSITEDNWYKNVQFEITYTPYVKSSVMYNQQTTFGTTFPMINEVQESIDLHSFGKNSLEKNKQLGNDNLLLYATTPTTYNYEIGQTLGDYVLTKTEAQIYPNKTMWTLGFTKYFTSENAYTLLDRQKRYYSLANNEYIDRNILKVQRLIIANRNTSNTFYDTGEMMHFMFSTSDGIRYARLKPIVSITGNAWIYSIQMEDATNIGFFRTEETIDGDDITIETSQGLQYVDSYGRCDDLYIGLRTESAQEKSDGGGCYLGKIGRGWNKPFYYRGGDSAWAWDLEDNQAAFDSLSSDYGGTLVDNTTYEVNKDSREKINITLEYSIEGDSNTYCSEDVANLFGRTRVDCYFVDSTLFKATDYKKTLSNDELTSGDYPNTFAYLDRTGILSGYYTNSSLNFTTKQTMIVKWNGLHLFTINDVIGVPSFTIKKL